MLYTPADCCSANDYVAMEQTPNNRDAVNDEDEGGTTTETEPSRRDAVKYSRCRVRTTHDDP